MNQEILVAWVLEHHGLDWRDLTERQKEHYRNLYDERHPVLQTLPPSAHERVLLLLNEALEDKLMHFSNHASGSIRAAMRVLQTVDLIAKYALEGKLKVIESGRDCDGVEYDGRVHTIEATLEAMEALNDEIGEYADGPWRLDIVAWDEEVEYTSRDLVMEAHENGHRHSIVSRFP